MKPKSETHIEQGYRLLREKIEELGAEHSELADKVESLETAVVNALEALEQTRRYLDSNLRDIRDLPYTDMMRVTYEGILAGLDDAIDECKKVQP